MSNRAEERALEAYPIKQSYNDYYGDYEDINIVERISFQEGYEQAEKDTIERAVAWLKEHADNYIVDLTPTYPDAPVNIIIGGMCWEDLKKALMEEQK